MCPQIKASIIELMLTSPEQIQRQLSDAISLISREDFPDKWPQLLAGMVARLRQRPATVDDFRVTNGVLRTAHSIFKRYRHEFQVQLSDVSIQMASFFNCVHLK